MKRIEKYVLGPNLEIFDTERGQQICEGMD